MNDLQEYPDFLQSYANLKTHFEENYSGLAPNQKGTRFAEFVESLIPYTEYGRLFDKPEMNQKSHDGGVDLTATNEEGQILFTQAKYTLKDKADFGSIISKFHDYYKQRYSEKVGPLFAHSGIDDLSVPQTLFQIITLHDLSRIKSRYEQSQLTSREFYRELIASNRLQIVDGHDILYLLRMAYRKTNLLPSNFDLEFVTEPIVWDGVYLGIVSSSQLIKLYQEYNDALFFENLRDFLSSTEVNQNIVKTVKENPMQLLARNNGIVIKATKIEKLPNQPVLSLYEGSVVNGCQTTLSIVQNATTECYVPLKVVQSESGNGWEITRAANFQNQVKRFELELAQFFRPQIVKKQASRAGIGIKGNLSASSVIDAISNEKIIYEELRALFIGIFSKTPSNIFNTEFPDLTPDIIEKFYLDDAQGDKLFNSLFTIFQATRKISLAITKKLEQRKDKSSRDTYKRFFEERKYSYRSFFALLAASAVSGVDISEVKSSSKERYDHVSRFLEETVSIIENQPKQFHNYYRHTVLAVSGSVRGRGKAERQQYLWKFMRNTEFDVFLELVYQMADSDTIFHDE